MSMQVQNSFPFSDLFGDFTFGTDSIVSKGLCYARLEPDLFYYTIFDYNNAIFDHNNDTFSAIPPNYCDIINRERFSFISKNFPLKNDCFRSITNTSCLDVNGIVVSDISCIHYEESVDIVSMKPFN